MFILCNDVTKGLKLSVMVEQVIGANLTSMTFIAHACVYLYLLAWTDHLSENLN